MYKDVPRVSTFKYRFKLIIELKTNSAFVFKLDFLLKAISHFSVKKKVLKFELVASKHTFKSYFLCISMSNPLLINLLD